MKKSIDRLTTPSFSEVDLRTILNLALLYLFVFILQGFGRYGWRTYLIRASFKAGRDLRNEFVSHLFTLTSSFYEKNSVGDLLSLANGDVESIRDCLGPGILTFADSLIYLATIPIIMFLLSGKLTCIVLMPILILPFVIRFFQKRIHSRYKSSQNHYSNMSALSQESLNGVRVLKSFAKEDVQLDRFSKMSQTYVHLNLKLARYQTRFGPLMDFFTSLGLVLLLYFGGQFVLTETLTIGTYVAFQGYLQKMVWPMIALGFSLSSLERAKASEERLLKVLTSSSEIKSGTLNEVESKASPLLKFDQLNFSYPVNQNQKEFSLKNISFEVENGMRVAILGGVGSGKSTLLQLISRVYLAPSKKLFFKGHPIESYTFESLRKSMGIVPQDAFLFSETLSNNIAFRNRKNVDEVEVNKVIEEALFKKDLSNLSQGLKTLIGERGVTLSGGQRQRVAIARALYQSPELLIFDDAFSALDVKTEKQLLESLKKNVKSTLLFSTHRVSAAKEADLILYLEKGEIVERGNHESLLLQRGRYYQTVEHQKIKDEALDKILNFNPLEETRS